MNNNEGFQEWFKQSVVQKEGKPLIVFHGTGEEFSIFNTYPENRGLSGLGATAIGSHFTEDIEIARQYPFHGENKKVMEVYLSIQNPKKYRTITHLQKELLAFYEEHGLSFTGPDVVKTRLGNVSRFRQSLIEQGYDGITYLEGPPHNIRQNKKRVWVAFYPWQIKSTENQGTFDNSNNDIFY